MIRACSFRGDSSTIWRAGVSACLWVAISQGKSVKVEGGICTRQEHHCIYTQANGVTDILICLYSIHMN